MRIRLLALVAALALQPAFADSPQPSEKSVLQLLQLMHTHQILENTGAQMDETMKRSMQAATAQLQLSPEQEKIRDEYQAKMVAIVKDALSWSVLEPTLVQAYQNTFTVEEVNAMLKFYDSPVGQSVGAKLPAVNQQMAQLTQQRLRDLIPKMVEVQKEMAERLRTAGSGSAADSSSPQSPAH
jgi:hypothetical protein